MKLKSTLLNHLILNGNKHTSEKLILKNFKYNKKYCLKNHKEVLKSAVINSSPVVSIKQIKRGRKQVKEFPFILQKHIRISLAIKMILNTLDKKTELLFSTKFNNEIISASKNINSSAKKKEEIHESAFLAKKYANYRWF